MSTQICQCCNESEAPFVTLFPRQARKSMWRGLCGVDSVITVFWGVVAVMDQAFLQKCNVCVLSIVIHSIV